MRVTFVRALTLTATIAAVLVALGGVGTASAAENPLPTVKPLVPCHIATDRDALDPWEAPCVDEQTMVDSNQRILAAKTAAANAYIGYIYNLSSKDNYVRAQDWLTMVTGEGNVAKAPDSSATLVAQGGLTAGAKRLKEQFFPFEQINSSYCGPATVESILSFLGPYTSATPNRETKQTDHLTGDPARDQSLLANPFWLATEKYHGTNWGEMYVPFALNAWRGSRWYVQDAGPGLSASGLTKDQALRNIRYDVDHGYPVAENVLYSPQTYYPAGFIPGVRYAHWDTIYGQTTDNGQAFVQVGQTYHAPSAPYERYQQVPWDVHWTAIAAWHGIVW